MKRFVLTFSKLDLFDQRWRRYPKADRCVPNDQKRDLTYLTYLNRPSKLSGRERALKELSAPIRRIGCDVSAHS